MKSLIQFRLFVFLLSNLLAAHCLAFTITDPGIKGYRNPEIKININQSSCPAGVDLAQIVSEAIETWNRVSWTRLKLSVGDESTATTRTYPPVAYCNSSAIGNFIGRGGSNYDSEGYFTIGAFEFNTNPSESGYVFNWSRDQLVSIAIHEIGHVIGIGHSTDLYAVMYPNVEPRKNLTLAQDDIDAVTYLYGRNELSGDKMLGGCGTIKKTNSGNGTPNPFMVLMFLFLPMITWTFLRFRTR